MTENEMIGQQHVVPAHCPVCGGIRLSFQDYCNDCEEWKKKAERVRKTQVRLLAFGGIL